MPRVQWKTLTHWFFPFAQQAQHSTACTAQSIPMVQWEVLMDWPLDLSSSRLSSPPLLVFVST